ncbi:MAG: caspase family protein [Myxococcota bacterium]
MFDFRLRRCALALSLLAGGLVSIGTSADARAVEPEAESPSPEAAEASTRRFALVIGSNHTLDPSQDPLRFADDDAARIAELLVELGVDTELVTQLDRDSQALFPGLVSRAHRPDDAGLESGYTALLGRMKRAKERGDEVELLVYYSGHGDVGPDGQGFLTLDDAKLTRKKLFGKLLSRSVADHNHIIIDACRSEQFVLSRGKDWKPDRSTVDLSRSVEEYLDKSHLGGFPNTGVILAHSADQQTHEWDRYRGGIFTHELVSGLRGGADLNGDGRIEYSELGGFVSAANHGVDDPRARLEVVVRPPVDDQRASVVEHGRVADHRVLLFGPGDQSRYTIEDSRGVRLADLHRTGEQYGYLRIPDGELFISRQEGDQERQEAQLASDQRGVLFAHHLGFTPAASAARGSLDQAFRRGLFSTPFGPGYYNGYTSQRGLLAVAEPRWQGPTEGSSITETAAPEDALEQEHGPDRVVVSVDGESVEIITDDDDDDDDDRPRRRIRMPHKRTWGGLYFGTTFTPFNRRSDLSPSTTRFTANDTRACLVPTDGNLCHQQRGFDVRWQLFEARSRSDYPRWLGYFRTGYEGGVATFNRDTGKLTGDAEAFNYTTVPLFLGGNVYLFDRFPLRPYAGLGFGLDVIRLDYDRFNSERLVDVVARPGFELHAGLEARITNYASIVIGVRQQWSARKKIDGVPDFANEGVTFVAGFSAGFPFRP